MAYSNPYGTPAGYPPPAAPSSSTATISLIMGILGLTLLPVLGSIVALFTGYSARNEINQSGGMIGGSGMATAGLILGWIGVVLGALTCCGVVIAFGFPFCMALFIPLISQYQFIPFILPFI